MINFVLRITITLLILSLLLSCGQPMQEPPSSKEDISSPPPKNHPPSDNSGDTDKERAREQARLKKLEQERLARQRRESSSAEKRRIAERILREKQTKGGMTLFSWPPPKPSSFSTIRRDYFVLAKQATQLADVEKSLRASLDSAGYYDVSYYGIDSQPNAFVMATRLEKINDNATPVDDETRWVMQLEKESSFSLSDYFSALFYAKPGKYRIILFIVSAETIHFTSEKVSAQKAKAWVSDGNPSLAPEIKSLEFSENHQVTALIYEFEKGAIDSDETDSNNTYLKLPGQHQTRTHLVKSGLWQNISGQK